MNQPIRKRRRRIIDSEENEFFLIQYEFVSNDVLDRPQGRGGNITINAESLLGIEERPLNRDTNDINASSQVSGLDGIINIRITKINPAQGATELPTNIVVPEETVSQACSSNRERLAFLLASINRITIFSNSICTTYHKAIAEVKASKELIDC